MDLRGIEDQVSRRTAPSIGSLVSTFSIWASTALLVSLSGISELQAVTTALIRTENRVARKNLFIIHFSNKNRASHSIDTPYAVFPQHHVDRKSLQTIGRSSYQNIFGKHI